MKGNSNIKNYINREMEKYHYLIEQGENVNNNNDNNISKDKNISNPPKNSNEKPENNNKKIISRNVESDLIQKSENMNLVKNTAETEGDENNENKKIKLNPIIKKEDIYFSKNDKLKIAIDQNRTNDSTSKREVNQNNPIMTLNKTEETLGEKDKEKNEKNIINSKNTITDSKLKNDIEDEKILLTPRNFLIYKQDPFTSYKINKFVQDLNSDLTYKNRFILSKKFGIQLDKFLLQREQCEKKKKNSIDKML